MSGTYSLELTAVERPQQAIEGAEILLVATGTRGAVALEGGWLHSGLHINSIGSTAPEQREIDPEVWRRADRIALDTHRLLHESGDALAADDAGALDRSKIVELNQIVAGQAPGRASPGQTTLYKSVGTGLQDIAAASRIYQRAREQGVGSEIPDFQTAKLPSR
jgi:ornithine cyclodeaminase/alanine dehydrogenase